MLLDIHLEWCDDKGEKLKKLAELGERFNISLVPVLMIPNHEVFKNGVYRSDYFYNKDIMEFLKKIPDDYPHINFGQQGFAHYCPDCFKTKHEKEKRFKHDPWHENKCLYGPEKSVEEQMKFMDRGIRVIQDDLHITPKLYVSPNHQGDTNTKIAAKELGFNGIVIKKMIDVPFYWHDSDFYILPETKLGKKGSLIYVHYDQMEGDFDKYVEIVKSHHSNQDTHGAFDFGNPKLKPWANDKLVTLYKRARDLGLR